MTRNEWLILGGAGILGFYFYKKSQAVPNAVTTLKTALTVPGPINVAGITSAVGTLESAISGLFSSPATPSNPSPTVTTGGSAINDSFGTVGVADLLGAPVGPPAPATFDSTLLSSLSLNGWPRSNASRFMGNVLRPDQVPDVLEMPDYRMPVVDTAYLNLPGRPNPATLARPRY
jgi:hypothetical protein